MYICFQLKIQRFFIRFFLLLLDFFLCAHINCLNWNSTKTTQKRRRQFVFLVFYSLYLKKTREIIFKKICFSFCVFIKKRYNFCLYIKYVCLFFYLFVCFSFYINFEVLMKMGEGLSFKIFFCFFTMAFHLRKKMFLGGFDFF